MSRRIVLVRHGQSEWNAQHRIQGQSGAGLTELGRAQAEGTAAWVATTHPDASARESKVCSPCCTAPVPLWPWKPITSGTGLDGFASGPCSIYVLV